MKENLKKVKQLIEDSAKDSQKRDLLLGQALGILEVLISGVDEDSKYVAPSVVQKQFENTNSNIMQNAVDRHKQIHEQLSKDSISQKNTQFEQLK